MGTPETGRRPTIKSLSRATLRAGVLGVRAARRRRSRLFEQLGSARYSRMALDDLDGKLEPYLPDGGVFVEAGANDGFRVSNSYYLERFRGWSGILIEPIPSLAARCRRNRPGARVYQCALVGAQHAGAEVVVRYADMYSEIVLDGGPRPPIAWAWDDPYDVVVPARTLSDVLSDAGVDRVDFLSLDLQGFEAAALSGLDLERWAPGIMLIEALDDGAERAVEAVLGAGYERVARLSPHDVLYRLISRSNRA